MVDQKEVNRKRKEEQKVKMRALRHCTKPDRDVPAIICGYPLPCPYHTLVMTEDQALNVLEEKADMEEVSDQLLRKDE